MNIFNEIADEYEAALIEFEEAREKYTTAFIEAVKELNLKGRPSRLTYRQLGALAKKPTGEGNYTSQYIHTLVSDEKTPPLALVRGLAEGLAEMESQKGGTS